MSEKEGTLPKFAVGSDVRVKKGVTAPNCPDMPLGGWCGKVYQASGTLTSFIGLEPRWKPSIPSIVNGGNGMAWIVGTSWFQEGCWRPIRGSRCASSNRTEEIR